MTRPFIFTTSWDDGSTCDLRLADLLAKHRLPATFYIPRCSQRPVLTDTDIQRLSSGFEIGAHTIRHAVLTRVSDQQARGEILHSKQWVEDITSRPCSLFCFPAGRFRKRHLEFVRDAGFCGVRTVELMSLDPPRTVSSIALMPTTVQAFPHTMVSYMKNSGKRLATRSLWNYVRYGRSRDWVQLAGRLLQHAAEHGGVFHLWGHSWELEERDLWQNVEEFFRYAAEYGKQAQFLTNSEVCRLPGNSQAPCQPADLSG